jgi:hypothetical protein
MHRALRGLTLLISVAALHAPAQQSTTPQQPAGLETDWDIAVILNSISAHAGRLLPQLDRADAASWLKKGASETYAAQLQSARDQARAIADGAKALAGDPEKLSSSLELFFRIQGLETMLGSVEDAIRKYQSPAEAQALIALDAESGENRDRFQRYIVNLAAEREKEYKVMDQEAQRCRNLAAPPAASGKRKK